jgi:hypothetical protein
MPTIAAAMLPRCSNEVRAALIDRTDGRCVDSGLKALSWLNRC